MRAIFFYVDRCIDRASNNIFLVSMVLAFCYWIILFLVAPPLHIFDVKFDGWLDLGRRLWPHADAGAADEVLVQDSKTDGPPADTKQGGYLLALNWSACSALLLPIITVFSLRIRRCMAPTVKALAETGMVRDAAFGRIGAAQFVERWETDRRRFIGLPVIVFIIAALFVFDNFWTTVASPVIQGLPHHLHIHDANYEYDWSVACLMQNVAVPGGCAANLAFDAVAYGLIPVLASSLAFSTFIEAIFFMCFIVSALQSAPAVGSDGQALPTDWRLTAIPSDPGDKTCGSGSVRRFFFALLLDAIVILFSLILMIGQNTYLRDQTSSDIWNFLSQDWSGAAAQVEKLKSLKAGAGDILGLLRGSKQIYYTVTLVGAGVALFAFVVLPSLIASWAILNLYAEQSRERGLGHAKALGEEAGVSETAVVDKLNHMVFWPVGWPSQLQAALIVIFLALSFLSYRLLCIPLLLGIVWAVLALMGKGKDPARKRGGTARRNRAARGGVAGGADAS